jgi:prepilin-type N-terminal cleavage/methylation domain-containing protein
MKFVPKNTGAFTLVELLVVIVIVGVLALLLMPQISRTIGSGRSTTSAIANARGLQTATTMMALDTASAGGNGMDWTMWSSKGRTTPVSLAAYFAALTDNNYLTVAELRKLLTAPGVTPQGNQLSSEPVAFRFFQFDHTAPSDQPFIVTANWQDRHLTDAAPYSKKGFVYFTKGGDGGAKTRPTDAASPNIFPAGSKDGHPYSYVILH